MGSSFLSAVTALSHVRVCTMLVRVSWVSVLMSGTAASALSSRSPM